MVRYHYRGNYETNDAGKKGEVGIHTMPSTLVGRMVGTRRFNAQVTSEKSDGESLVHEEANWTTFTSDWSNSRPITHVPSGGNEYEALTPAHFLIGRSLTSTAATVPKPKMDPTKNSTAIELSRRIRFRAKVITNFWRRWRREYLTKLALRSKWHEFGTEPKVGKIALVANDNVRDIHENSLHHWGGSGTLLTELNQKFWIVHGRELVWKVIRNCVICQMKRAS